MTENKKGRTPKKGRGYLAKEQGLCITVFDLGGNPIPPETVEEILDVVNAKSLEKGLMLTFTQT